MRPFRLALIQLQVEPGDAASNLLRAERSTQQAVDLGAEVVLLPETLDCGWTHPAARRLAEPIPDGAPFQQLQRLSARHHVYLCAGLVERDGESLYNAAVLLDPNGELLIKHRKIHELEIALDLYRTGQSLQVVPTPLASFGLMICADGFAEADAVGRALGYMGADVILSPCAWAVPSDHNQIQNPYGDLWRHHYGTVAREFNLWIAAASCVGSITDGPWRGRNCIGNSMVVNPDGIVATEGPHGVNAETILICEIQPLDRPARGTGWTGFQTARAPHP